MIRLYGIAAVLGSAAVFAGHTSVTLEETVAFRTIESVLLSPDGLTVAAIIRAPDLASNRNRYILTAVDAATGTATPLLESEKLRDPLWSSDSESLYVLGQTGEGETVILQVAIKDQAVRTLVRVAGINRFAVSENTGRIAYCVTAAPDPLIERRVRERGFVYEFGRHSVRNIIKRDYVEPEWEDIYLCEPGSVESRLIHRLPYGGPSRHLPFVTGLSLSPDGRKLCLQLMRRGKPTEGGDAFDRHVGLLDLLGGDYIEPLRNSIQRLGATAWSPDSRRLYFFADAELMGWDTISRELLRPGIVMPEGSYPSESRFAQDGQSLSIVGRSGHFRWMVGSDAVEKIAGPEFASATFDGALRRYALIDESSGSKPEIAVGDLGGSPRRLTDVNPGLDVRRLGHVTPIVVKNSVGTPVNAYLVHPPGFQTGVRYPLVVATYGFRGKFVLQGEWHSTFPAQVLAAQGYLVLLLNRPMPLGQGIVGNPAKARDIEGWQMLSTVEAAIDGLVRQGIADSNRIGLYGWSHGAFIVEFILTHSPRRFRSASLGEGGDYKPGGYWKFGDTIWPDIYGNMFGGPLSAKTAQAYLEFSPGMRLEHIHTPLLMEFIGGSISGLETFVPLRHQRIPAELVLYDGELHNFVMPLARFASMERKVDWFNFWMLGKEDPDPAKTEQYARWDKMQAEWEASKAEDHRQKLDSNATQNSKN